MLRGARCDICERPGCLELQLGHVCALQELDEAGDDALGDDFFDGRAAFDGEELAELGGCFELGIGIVGVQTLHHGRQCFELHIANNGNGEVMIER